MQVQVQAGECAVFQQGPAVSVPGTYSVWLLSKAQPLIGDDDIWSAALLFLFMCGFVAIPSRLICHSVVGHLYLDVANQQPGCCSQSS